MRKILSTCVNKKEPFTILSYFQIIGIIFFILSLPCVSFSQQIEKLSTIEGQLIRSIPSLKKFKPGLISPQTSLAKKKEMPNLRNLSANNIDYGTKAKSDPVLQRVSSTAKLSSQEANSLAIIPSAVDENFDGIGFTGIFPASPSIAAGPDHVIQMTNGATGSFFKIWDRDGNVVINQTILSSLFSGGGYAGESYPVAIYDQFADRYMMTELGTVGGSILVNTLVIAISQTNDPTGGWNLYKFTDNSFYHNYPHFAAWPNALYATTNDFSYDGSFFDFLGISLYAIDKNQMVAGNLTVPLVRYRILTTYMVDICPVNISGSTPPAPGSPGMFMYFSDDNFTSSFTDVDSVGFISLQPDFATPANSAVSFFQQIAVAPFKSGLCNYDPNCIPAPGGLRYAAISDRFMRRIYYRNFGTHESIVANHTVDANYPSPPQKAGVRWYEFRRTGGEWSTYQQGTYSPDAQSRWMGSIGINSKGQIALSYNLASSTRFGSFYFTGRNAGDALNQMSIAENAIINASGYGTSGTRWGAYNDMATDVVNDSLFWTTAMYGFTFDTWKTRVAAIKIGDIPVPLPTPPLVTINQAAGQSDPTSGSPIHFTVTFDQEVTGFTSSDISFTGSTPFILFIPDVTVTGGPIVYDVAVSGMTSSGTVIATVPAGSALNAASQSNSASTSTDNSVIYNIPPCSITCPSNITVAATSLSGAVVNYSVTPAGDCQNIVRVPVSGTTFPVGTTTVNAYNNVSTGLVYGLSRSTDVNSGFLINELVTFNVNTSGPTTLSTPIPITGISFPMVAIDFRPSNGQLYGLEVFWLSNHYGGKIYTINKNTGVATPLTLDDFDLSDASSFDIDFDPVTGMLRVTDGKGTNLRIDPDLGTVLASDPALIAGFLAAAYANTFASSTFTTLYEINSLTNALYIQGGINGIPSPNTGSTTLVGPLGVDVEQEFTGFGGFDISLSAGALATFLVDGASKLYSINLNSGAATLIGTFNGSVIDIAIAPVTLPAPSCSFTVTVTPPAPAVTINKASTQADPTNIVPVHFTVVFDQDVTGFDASDISFAGSTAQGSLVATISGTGPTYDVSVSGITGAGDVIAGINAGAAQNNSGQGSQVSTSDDNVITVTQILEPPQITCPGNIVLNIEPGRCDARVSFTGENEVIVTGTSVYSLSYSINSENGSLNGTGNLSSYSLPVGVNTVNITAANDAGSSSCSFTVTVVDDQPPVLNCSSDITVNAQAGQCSAMVTYNISGSENCMDAQHPLTIQTSTGTIFNLSGPQSLSISQTFQVGTIRINVFATDAAGNTATCSFNVTVVDNEKPVINCPSSVTVSCASEIPVPNISAASASDNCGTTTITHVGDVITNQACANKYTVTRTYKATDGSGNTATCSQLITVDDNTPPQLTALTASKQVLWPANHKMVDVMLNYSVNDNCVSTPNVTINITSNEPENGTGDGDTGTDWEIIDDHHVRLRAERAANGTGRIYTITVRVSDGCNASVSATTQVMVVHNITAPHSGNAFKVGSTVAFSGEFWDKPGNKHTAKWQIDGSTTSGAVTEPSGNKNGKVTGSYKFNTPGVYKLQMNVTDQTGVTSYANTNGDLEAIVVIYDPNGGHTYGGGYYDSRAGALVSNPSSTGKASYGFAMNYFKNSTNPKGETQFEFKVGDFEFNALNFDYLVISNSMAQFKGTGKIIGGQSGVAFTMTVTDGQLDGSGIDKIRMKIYNKNNGRIIYDNQPGASDAALPTQAVGANSIVVISGINSSLTSANTSQKTEMEAAETKTVNGLDVIAYPNPTTNNFSITVQASAKEKITMQVVDMYGRVIETRNVNANSIVRFGDRYGSGTYFVRILQGKEHKEIKLVKLSD